MPKYSPSSHTTPHTASIDTIPVKGQGPACVFVQLSDPRNPNPIMVATKIDTDGFPTGMVPISPANVTTVS